MINGLLKIQFVIKALFEIIESFIKIILLSRIPTPLPPIQSDICSVLGNGASLNESLKNSLDFIKQTEIICLNHFSKSEYYNIIKPPNYFLLDPAFFLLEKDMLHKAIVLEMYEHLLKNLTWKMNLYVPQMAKKSKYFKDKVATHPNIKVIYFNYTILNGFERVRFWLFKHSFGMLQCQNVLAATLFTMINRRFKEIYIYGADHGWHETIMLENNKILLKDDHFYDKKEIGARKLYDSNTNMGTQFMAIGKTFNSYYTIEKYARYIGVKVYNASEKSYIDAFEVYKHKY